MTGSTRKLGLLFALTALATSGYGQDLQSTLQTGVDSLRNGDEAAALESLQEVLAADPSSEDAYALWEATDHRTWSDLLVAGGQIEVATTRIMALAKKGRKARRNDREEILAGLTGVRSEDFIERERAILTLSANHGEYAVPYMLTTLADRGNEDQRVTYMYALTEMGTDVVPPLIEALNSEDPYLRRNVALTLGYVGDSRAAGALALHASADDEAAVRAAATDALGRIGVDSDPVATNLQQGEDYTLKRDNVLAPYQYSDVVWEWSNDRLMPRAVPEDIYNDELAIKAYGRALKADPGSMPARAGLARAAASRLAKLESMQADGQDVADLIEAAQEHSIAVGIAGADALDAALADSNKNQDYLGAIALTHALANNATSVGPGLSGALSSDDAALRTHAAIAITHIAVTSGTSADAGVVQVLGDAVGREVVRTAIVVDANGGRASQIEAGLADKGLDTHVLGTGAGGLSLMHRIPGADVVLVAETLPDLTAHQVIDDLRRSPRYENTPILLISADAEAAGDLFGAKTQGIVTDDLAVVDEVLASELDGDRAEADRLGNAAAGALASLARNGTDISGASEGLRRALDYRSDAAVGSVMAALGVAGDARHLEGLGRILADAGRSDEARAGAGNAAARILSRGAQPPAGALETLTAVVESDASIDVRRAAARAIGALQISGEARAQILARIRASEGGGDEGGDDDSEE